MKSGGVFKGLTRPKTEFDLYILLSFNWYKISSESAYWVVMSSLVHTIQL